MLELDLAEYFAERGWTFKLKDGNSIIPNESDFEVVLDSAVKTLYDEPVGAQLEVGRLIIIKQHLGYDVYVLAGNFY